MGACQIPLGSVSDKGYERERLPHEKNAASRATGGARPVRPVSSTRRERTHGWGRLTRAVLKTTHPQILRTERVLPFLVPAVSRPDLAVSPCGTSRRTGPVPLTVLAGRGHTLRRAPSLLPGSPVVDTS